MKLWHVLKKIVLPHLSPVLAQEIMRVEYEDWGDKLDDTSNEKSGRQGKKKACKFFFKMKWDEIYNL